MKPTSQTSFPHGHRALLAAAVAMLLAAGTGYAQTGSGTGTSGSGSTSSTSDRPSTATTATDSSRSDQTSSQAGSSTAGSSVDTSGTSGGTSDLGRTSSDTSTTSSVGAGAPTGRDTMASDKKLGWGDRRFVTKAAEAGMTEVQLAQLAATQASNTEVRNYAQKLVEDHSMVNSELTTLASRKNVEIDQDDDKDRAYKRLADKTGSEFDREFVEHMIDEHEKDIKMFEKAAEDAKDPDVRAFASKHVGHLREHLQRAESLRATIMPTGRTDDDEARSTSTGADTSATGTSTTGSGSTDTSTSGLGTSSSSTSGTSSSDDTSSSTTRPRDGSR